VPNPGAVDGLQRGVYYFAGWKGYSYDLGYPGRENPYGSDVWHLIRDEHDNYIGPQYPDRKPELGFVSEDSQDAADAQILAMKDAGFDFVTYEVIWSHDKWLHYGLPADSIFQGYAADNHKTSQYADQVKMAITWHELWAGTGSDIPDFWDDPNRGYTVAKYEDDVRAMVNTWFNRYITGNPNFYRVDGKPVIFLFAPEGLDRLGQHWGHDGAYITNLLQSAAAAHGERFYLVGTSVAPSAVSSLASWGLDAFSGYQEGGGNTYGAVTDYYRNVVWPNAISQSTLTYWVPNVTGGDGTAWNHPNLGASDLSTFDAHLASATSFAKTYAARTRGFLMTCCWNEWGEGEYMQPSVIDFDGNLHLKHQGADLAGVHRRIVLHDGAAGNPDELPFGWFDAIEPSGVAWGWALDPDTPNQPLYVQFYVLTFEQEITIGRVKTDQLRADINQGFGVVGTHGFSWQVPEQWRGANIYVRLINSVGDPSRNPTVGGSPRSF
jgi:hypothetical protein